MHLIAPPTRRPRAHHRVNPYPGALKQNEIEMFSDHDETSLSIAAVSAPYSTTLSTLLLTLYCIIFKVLTYNFWLCAHGYLYDVCLATGATRKFALLEASLS